MREQCITGHINFFNWPGNKANIHSATVALCIERWSQLVYTKFQLLSSLCSSAMVCGCINALPVIWHASMYKSNCH